MTELTGRDLTLAYDGRVVVDGVDVDLPTGRFTVIVGPNACGKSTLLRGLVRLLAPTRGAVLLDGTDISRVPTREVARRIGLLPQSPAVPAGLTVEALVRRGRFPHQGLLRGWTRADQEAVDRALDRAGIVALRSREVDELSGGQRQRAWIALTLAQETPLLLLDEPTTYLDIRHQFDVLDLVAGLVHEGRTAVAVLHDLNQACRYADQLVVMRAGRVVAAGPPAGVLTADLVTDVFDLPCDLIPDPVTGTPLVVPHDRRPQRRPVPEPAGTSTH
ncbi:ABC transporter ATP-binding protein [Micromonospora sp. CPCC 206060]|uniref:ABC transporter ATP-binding protein n=1 Tax=Micromonospora sp. CPCC 206060 TaxID=3122406 RepID=UPI002FEEE518